MQSQMKREISPQQHSLIHEQWTGQFDGFSPYEFICGIPHPLFMITTRKANGAANACFHSWSCFSGDGGGYYAILSALGIQTHTYANIMRERQFCVNFLSREYYQNCLDTVSRNSLADNEIIAGGFTEERSHSIDCPRIGEAFLVLECTLEHCVDLSQREINALVIGRVRHIGMEESYIEGIDRKYSDAGFMFNIHSPVDFASGDCDSSAVASLGDVERK